MKQTDFSRQRKEVNLWSPIARRAGNFGRTQVPEEGYVGVPEDVQKDEFDHFPMYDPTRQQCKVCPRKNSAF